MIIQCKQCRTKFRFDDAQIVGDGLWMRCSRCQHVFFQESPQKVNVGAGMSETNQSFTPQANAPNTSGRLAFEPAGSARKGSVPDEDVADFLRDVMGAQKPVSEEGKRKTRSAHKNGDGLADIDLSADFENLDDSEETADENSEMPVEPARKKRRLWMAVLWTILVVVLIPALIYFVVFPQVGDHAVKVILKSIGLAGPVESQSVAGQIKLQDVRQRIMNNYIMGNLRIVEGTAVNQADFPVSRIMIKAELLDPYAVVLGQQVSYAGNILSDEELVTLSGDEILKRLAQPEGRDNSNDRVVPNGRIPFMIVFSQEPPGVIKTMVKIVGAERLL